jgi:hypothetical protein
VAIQRELGDLYRSRGEWERAANAYRAAGDEAAAAEAAKGDPWELPNGELCTGYPAPEEELRQAWPGEAVVVAGAPGDAPGPASSEPTRPPGAP